MVPDSVTLDEGVSRKQLNAYRDRFLDLSNARLRRILQTLPTVQRDVLELLPVLFHFNHPMLPGYVNSDTPTGIADYQPPRSALLLARKLARSLPSNNLAQRVYPIRGLYLMGSLGSIGQDNKSDLDLWLCHDEDLPEEQVAHLQQKIQGIEDWGHTLGLEVHVFIVNVDAFRRGGYNELSEESSGSTQHHLLLEEFYRTGVVLAGLAPLWWLVPPDQEDSYAAYCKRLTIHGFINPHHWIDLGSLDRIPAQEFFSAAHWQLHKSIDSPYKALLKLMLFEAYSSEYPDVRWLSLKAKAAIQGIEQPDADALDPYRLILQRITDYLTQRGEHDRLELARRAFYVKSGAALSRFRNSTWKTQALTELVASWGWREGDIRLMDSRSHWKLDRVLSERNALVAELSRSYRLLTDFARLHSDTSDLNARDLSLLGRKLHAAMERRPGKVDRVNPGLSGDLSEEALWLRHEPEGEGRWLLYRAPPERSTAAHVTRSLVELLAWAHVNGLAGPGTQVRIDPPRPETTTPEHLRLLKTLRKHLRPADVASGSLESFAHSPRLRQALLFINVMRDPLESLSSAGLQRITEMSDPFNFSTTKQCLAQSIDLLQVTTWGEILVERYADGIDGLLDVLCNLLDKSCDSDGCVTPRLHVHSYSSVRGPAIANRTLELINRLFAAFAETPTAAGYILKAGFRLYLIERAGGFRWLQIGDHADLLEYLAEPLEHYRALSFDPLALDNSPLPLIYRHHAAGRIEAFYRLHPDGIELWVLDEHGALFEQRLDNALEHHFLTQQLRFFNSVLSERLVGTTQHARKALAGRIHFYRIETGRDTRLSLQAVRPADEGQANFLDLQVLLGPPGAELGDFSVLAGSREFSSLVLGEQIYLEIARYLMTHRRRLEPYPFYITGIQPAELDDQVRLPVIRLLHIKRRLEQRLNEAQFTALVPVR